MNDAIIPTVIPHSSFGDPECCGCLTGIVQGSQADIACNECAVVVRTVAASDLQRALDEMELELDLASAKCPHCGTVHLAPGVSELIAFLCDKCGSSVNVQ